MSVILVTSHVLMTSPVQVPLAASLTAVLSSALEPGRKTAPTGMRRRRSRIEGNMVEEGREVRGRNDEIGWGRKGN